MHPASKAKNAINGNDQQSFLAPGPILETADHDLHRSRRGALNRLFSTASVRRLQFVIEERVQVLLERFRRFKNVEVEEVVKADYAFTVFTNSKVHAPTCFAIYPLTRHQM